MPDKLHAFQNLPRRCRVSFLVLNDQTRESFFLALHSTDFPLVIHLLPRARVLLKTHRILAPKDDDASEHSEVCIVLLSSNLKVNFVDQIKTD